jgi:ribosome recycling factor
MLIPEVDKIMENLNGHLTKSVQNFKQELTKVRTGKASSVLVDSLHIDYYGSSTALSQLANITTPDAKTIQITPWEAGIVGAIEKAILAANLGLTPQNDGKLIRISLPSLTEERRKEMGKLVKKMGEEIKIALRNFRRDANEDLKKLKSISEDDLKKASQLVQKKLDDKVAEVDKMVIAKEKEILTI